MYRVTYCSRATRYFSHQGIDSLKATCRRNNMRAGLTGILIYHEGRFFQVLEGDDARLLYALRKICRDQRHTALTLVAHGPIERRAFQNWRMGYEMQEALAGGRGAAIALRELLPRDSRYRGQDPDVRNDVRQFLSSLRHLPQAAAG